MKQFKWITNLVKSLVHEKTKAFFGGCAGGLPVWTGVFFLNISPNEHEFLFHVAKAVGALSLTFISGLLTALGKDLYDYLKANKKIKRQRKSKNQKTDQHEYKQIWGKNGKQDNGDHKNTA